MQPKKKPATRVAKRKALHSANEAGLSLLYSTREYPVAYFSLNVIGSDIFTRTD